MVQSTRVKRAERICLCAGPGRSCALLLWAAPAAAEELKVEPDAGTHTFSAIRDVMLGERITAMSSPVACDVLAAHSRKLIDLSGPEQWPETVPLLASNERPRTAGSRRAFRSR